MVWLDVETVRRPDVAKVKAPERPFAVETKTVGMVVEGTGVPVAIRSPDESQAAKELVGIPTIVPLKVLVLDTVRPPVIETPGTVFVAFGVIETMRFWLTPPIGTLSILRFVAVALFELLFSISHPPLEALTVFGVLFT